MISMSSGSDPIAGSQTVNDRTLSSVAAKRPVQVGVIDPHYNLERVSYGLKPAGYKYRKVRRVPIQRLERRGTFLNYTPLLFDRGIDLVHTFNMIPLNARRFVLHCEMELPRYLGLVKPWQVRLGQRLLGSAPCRSILTLSDIAATQAKHKYQELGMPEIADKIKTFRGAVAPSRHDSIKQPSQSGPLKLLFVGRDAVRKGLVPTLDAIEEIRRGGLEVTLTIVSGLDAEGDYVFGPFAPSLSLLKNRVKSTPWVDHIEGAPNDRVRDLMREHDAFILPTMDESLGWVFIEALSEACPVITTDVFAIPELVEDGVSGYLLKVPCNEDRRWEGLFLDGDEKREAVLKVTSSFHDQLVTIIQDAHADRESLASKGIAGQRAMSQLYGRDQATKELQGIYEHALR